MPWKIWHEVSRKVWGGSPMLCRRSWGVLAGRVGVGLPAPFRRSRGPLANGVKVGLLAAAVAGAADPLQVVNAPGATPIRTEPELTPCAVAKSPGAKARPTSEGN
jgi:hypothetical protein